MISPQSGRMARGTDDTEFKREENDDDAEWDSENVGDEEENEVEKDDNGHAVIMRKEKTGTTAIEDDSDRDDEDTILKYQRGEFVL